MIRKPKKKIKSKLYVVIPNTERSKRKQIKGATSLLSYQKVCLSRDSYRYVYLLCTVVLLVAYLSKN
jgi:hypothetical protein